MHRIVNDEALDALFRAAAQPEAWLDRRVSDTLLRALAELVRLGPTNGGGEPHLVFVKSEAARVRLAAAIAADGASGTSGAMRQVAIRAPAVAILGYRVAVDDTGGRAPPRCGKAGRGAAARDCVLRAGALILAARALGLDCHPLWEFDAPSVDAAFFPDSDIFADFLCALGYGSAAAPASAVPTTNGACEIL